MKFTNEQLTKAKAAKSAQEILMLAKENSIDLTEEEAEKHFADLHKEGEIADNELGNVVGGCGDDDEEIQVKKVFANYAVCGSYVSYDGSNYKYKSCGLCLYFDGWSRTRAECEGICTK